MPIGIMLSKDSMMQLAGGGVYGKEVGRMKKHISLLLAVAMVFSLCSTMAFATTGTGETAPAAETEGTDTVNYTLSLSYDDTLCSVRVVDGTQQNQPDQTVFVTGNGSSTQVPEGTWVIFEIYDIAEGYRIKNVTITGVSYKTDYTAEFINGAYGGLSFSKANRDYGLTAEMEPIPETLPTITGVTLYTNSACTNAAPEDIDYLSDADAASARLYGSAAFSDGTGYPAYYAAGQWQYSTDGVTWHNTESWGSNRFDFWPGWSYHDTEGEIDYLNDSYDIRLVATPKDLYTTGNAVYSNVLHINGGASADQTGGETAGQLTRAEFALLFYNAFSWNGVSGSASFDDIGSCTAQQQEAILTLVNAGVLRGMADGKFMPDNSITRAEAVNVIWQFAGSPDGSGVTLPYSDVADGMWYTNAVKGLYAAGTLDGTDVNASGGFDPTGAADADSVQKWLDKVDVKLPAPAGLGWREDGTMIWDAVAGAGSYDVKIYWSQTETLTLPEGGAEETEEFFANSYVGWFDTESTAFVMPNSLIDRQDGGYYFFRVQAISGDALAGTDSDWSALSAGRQLEVRRLAAPSTPTVAEDGTVSWSWTDGEAQSALLGGYTVQVLYAATEGGTPEVLTEFYVNKRYTQTDEWKSCAEQDGWYYFRVCAESNSYDQYRVSSWSESSAGYQHDVPDPLAAPSDLSWNGSMIRWTPSASGIDGINGYYAQLYYCGTDGSAVPVMRASVWVDAESTGLCFDAYAFTENGAGVYKFCLSTESNDLDTASNSEWVWCEQTFTYVPTTAKIDAPTGLRWEGQTMMWEVPEDTTTVAEYQVRYYVPGNEDDYRSCGGLKPGEFFTLPSWAMEQLGAEIYFQVRALSGDLNSGLDSDWAYCTTTYEPPAGLPEPTDPAWDGTTMTWSWDGGEMEEYLNNFNVRVYYAATQGGECVQLGDYYWADQSERTLELRRWAEEAEADGWYSFDVCARSNDREAYANSGWSVRSAEFYYEPAPALAAPGNVTLDGSTVTWTASADEQINAFSEYQLMVYYYGTASRPEGPYEADWYYITGEYDTGASYRFAAPQETFNWGEGIYEFRVRACSWKPEENSNSGWITAGRFTYTGTPDAQLAAPTGLYWDGTTMKWDVVTDGSVGGYQVEFYSADEQQRDSRMVRVGQFCQLYDWHLREWSAPVYFKVRAISGNANAAGDSEWSAVCTDGYTLPDPLPTPSVPVFDGEGSVTWTWNDSGDMLDHFLWELYYSATETGEKTLCFSGGTNDYSIRNENWKEDVDQAGWYFIRVRARSWDMTQTPHSQWSDFSSGYYFAPAPALEAPTNLAWDGSVATWTDTANDPYQVSRYQYEVRYLDGSDQCNILGRSVETTCGMIPVSAFREFGAGKYIFRVRALPNDITIRSASPWVESGEFTYTPAAATLAVPTNLRWDGTTAKWDAVNDAAVAGYRVTFYSHNGDWSYDEFVPAGTFVTLRDWAFENAGGDIYFSVSAVSANVNVISDSAEVSCGEAASAADPLPTPSVPVISGDNTVTWTWSGNTNLLRCYDLELYYSATRDGERTRIDDFGTNNTTYYEWKEMATKSGWYFVRVRAASNSTLEAANSDWSQFSEGYELVFGPALKSVTDVQMDGTTVKFRDYGNDPDLVAYYKVELIRNGQQLDWSRVHWNRQNNYIEMSFPSSVFQRGGDGEYTMVITACSEDPSVAAPGAPVTGPAFTYKNPGVALAAPTNLRWVGGTMVWDVPADTSNIDNYWVRCYNIDNPNGSSWGRHVQPGEFWTVEAEMIRDLGQNLGFEVRAVSKNANAASDSAWVSCAGSYQHTGLMTQLSKPLNALFDPLTGVVTWDAVPGADGYNIEVFGVAADGTRISLNNLFMGGFNGGKFLLQTNKNYKDYVVKLIATGDGYLHSNSEPLEIPVKFTGLIKLSAPTDLTWGIEYDRDGNLMNIPGAATWTRGVDQSHYMIEYQRKNADGSWSTVLSHGRGEGSLNWEKHMTSWEFISQSRDMPSGTYRFRVYATGDGVCYESSDVAVSPEWTYTNPGVSLPAPANLYWDGRMMHWTNTVTDLYYGIEGRTYFTRVDSTANLNGVDHRDSAHGWWNQQFDLDMEDELPNFVLMAYGDGYYWFRTRTLSRDITKYTTSDWSVWSDSYDQGEVSDIVNSGINNALQQLPTATTDQLKNDTATQQKVANAVEAVKELDTDQVATAMAADQGTDATDSTLAKITKLEETLVATGKVESKVEADAGLVALTPAIVNKMEVVGSTLNLPKNETTGVVEGKATLKVGKADKEANVIPTQYHNTVQFSMHLEDADGDKSTMDDDPTVPGQQLAVPVRITIPVPTHINPNYLVVLHYIESIGRYEQIWPHVYQDESGDWMASFIVSSFSDFALVETKMTAVKTNANCVTVDLVVSGAAVTTKTLVCAVYDKLGRQIGTKVLEEIKDQSVTIACDSAKAHEVRLFLLDEGRVPVAELRNFVFK